MPFQQYRLIHTYSISGRVQLKISLAFATFLSKKGMPYAIHSMAMSRDRERERERFIALREYQNKIVVYAVLFSEKSMFYLEEHVVQMLQALKGCRIC